MKTKIVQISHRLAIYVTMILVMLLNVQLANADINSVDTVDFSTLEGGKLLVKVGLKQNLQNTPAGFTVNNPPRVALDLANTANGLGKNTVNVNQGPLRSINVVQAGDRTRLVLNLAKPAQYETRIDGNALFITLQDSDSQSTSNVTPRFAEAAAGNGKHSIKDIDFRRGAGGEGRVIATLSDSSTGIDIRKQGNGLSVDFMGTDIAHSLQRRLDVTDFGTPVQFVETVGRGNNVKMTITPKGDYEYSAYQADNQFIIEVRAKVDETAGKVAGSKPKYVGEKLSLNFQNVEVRSVLQVIADFTGKNIITSDTVTGNLTLRLKDVPWDQALDIILQSKGLDKRENGNVIWVAPKDELLAKEENELKSRQNMEALEPLVVRQYQLNYKKADQASRVLLGLPPLAGDNGEDVSCSAQAQGVKADKVVTTATPVTTTAIANPNRILSARGSATSESQTNTLIVNDIPSKQAEVAEMLKLIDTPAKQVMIEARVVVANDTFSRQLGARFGVQQGALAGNRIGYGSTAANASSTTTSGATGTAPFNVDLPAADVGNGTPATFGLSLFNLGSGALLSLELSALEADNRGKIISSPRIITANQKPAVILQGVQIPNVTPGTSTSPATVTFKDAFLCLLVNPQILNNDSVILTVEVQKDAQGTAVNLGSGGVAYPIDTKRVKTQIRINNGETAVLGGIYEQQTINNVSRVPFFGEIPVLGNLFKTTNKQNIKTELLVFLTPRIVKEDLSFK
jgi:type IV pilus assembly protein PilQ